MFKNNMRYTAIIRKDSQVTGELFEASHDRAEAWRYALENFTGELVAVVTGNQEVFSVNKSKDKKEV